MKLKHKLLISLTTVIIIMGLFQSLFFQTRVEKIFENYLSESDQMKIEMMKQVVISYYNSTGSLKGVDEILENANRMHMNMEKMMGIMGGSIQIIVLDSSGEIVADTTPKNMENKNSSVKEPLAINGENIGTLIAYPVKSASVSRLEQQFVQSVNATILFGFLIAVLLSLVIGLFLSQKISKPLTQLVSGIERVSKGKTNFRLSIDSKDEFSQLGDSFNKMTETLERTEHIRQSLVADVAHELRTPLAIIQAKLESIQAGALEATEEVILHISDEVYRLSRLVNDLQQLSLAESKTLSLHKERTEINGFVEAILSQFQWFADEKDIRLHFYENPTDIYIEIDRDRMTQVVVNLLGNALRYTRDSGTVIVDVKVEGKSVVLHFKDTGPGIDEQKLPFIFERFYRLDESRKRDEGGAGLGLSIAKGFVEVHGGTINVTSIKGEGTRFEVSLPIQGESVSDVEWDEK